MNLPYLRRVTALLPLVCLLLSPQPADAQDEPTWRWMPAGHVVPRFLADPLDPTTSLVKAIGNTTVAARMGARWDVLTWQSPRPVLGFRRAAFGLGGLADMALDMRSYGTKSLLSFPYGYDKILRFDLLEGDYYFGGYFVGVQYYHGLKARYRLHIAHLSSHLGDGFYNRAEGGWTDDRHPIYFSRNYGQLMLDLEFASGLRTYVEGSYLGFQSPLEPAPDRISWHAGAEYRYYTGTMLSPFAAVDVRTFNLSRRHETGEEVGMRLVGGIRIGQWEGRGVNLFVSHYSGTDWRGQSYNSSTRELGIGFTLEFH